MASRYQLAERLVWAKLSDWRKKAILDARVIGADSHFLDDFAHEVAQLAESSDFLAKISLAPSEEKELTKPTQSLKISPQ